jgi:transposase
LGEVQAWGIEGSGCYGAALTRFLHAHGQVVVEVNRPDRAARRRQGKSDPVDAEAAARAVQANDATGLPKSRDAKVEMLRCLRVARSTAVKARTQAINALKALGHRPRRSARAAARPVGHQAGTCRGHAATGQARHASGSD